MGANTYKKSILNDLSGLLLAGCRTILQFRAVALIAASFTFLISCGSDTTNNVINENKYIQSNSGNGSGEKGGTGDGGGGQGVYCSEEVADKQFKGRLLVRDIYEAISNHGPAMKQVNVTAEDSDKIKPEAFKVLVDSIKHYFGPASKNLPFTTDQFWLDFEKQISFISGDTDLNYSQDANSPISLPNGCKIVQIAFWRESSGPNDEGVLYVDQKQWRKLDQFNKIALLAHEFFFKQARQAGYKSSDFVREKVGQLLSVKGMDPLFKEWVGSKDSRVSDILPESMEGFKFCTGTSNEDVNAKLQFYQYEGKDRLQHFVIPLLQSSSVSLSLLKENHFSFDPRTNKDLAFGTDLMIFGEDLLYKFIGGNTRHTDSTGLEIAMRGREILTKMTEEDTSFTKKENQNLWSASINFASQIVQLSLLNPIDSTSIKTVIKQKISAEDLIRLAYDTLYTNFGYKFSVSSSEPGAETNEGLIRRTFDSAFVILSKEIDEAIKNGKYPIEYKKWRSALADIVKHPEQFSNYKVDAEGIFSDTLTNEIPEIIHKIKLNIQTENDISKIKREDFEDLDNEKPSGIYNRKEIVVKKNGIAVPLQMTCQTYTELYNSTLNNIDRYENDMEMQPIENIQLVLNEKFDEKTIRSILEEIPSLHSYKMRGLCGTLDEDAPICSDIILLKNSIYKEKKIEVKPCSSYFNPLDAYDNPKEDKSSCAMLTLYESKASYIIYFESHKNPFMLNFVRRIPYGYEVDSGSYDEMYNPEWNHTE